MFHQESVQQKRLIGRARDEAVHEHVHVVVGILQNSDWRDVARGDAIEGVADVDEKMQQRSVVSAGWQSNLEGGEWTEGDHPWVVDVGGVSYRQTER